MKNKKQIALAAAVVLAVTALPMTVFASKKDKEEEKLSKVTLNEVAHSVFYAPQYVAIEEGYFAEKGLDLTLVTGFGADKTMTAVISGEADIGFMGAEASVYAYQEGATDPVVNFAQLTQRAGNFLVAREEMPDFKWEDLKGKKVLGGRTGGMPEMVFEYILRKNGIDPRKDLTIDQSIDFGSTAAAFTGDESAAYTVEFEPSATILEKEGAGYVVASLGEASGYVPYTSYSAKTSYMKENPEIIRKFTEALQKGMDYVQSHTPEEIAEVIAPQFKETDLDILRYVNDYHINIIEPKDIKDFSKFKTELGKVLEFINASDSVAKVKEILENNHEYYLHMDIESARMIKTFGKVEIDMKQYEKNKEKVNMCKALEDMVLEGKQQGIEEGMQAGIQEGIKEGIKALIEVAKELGATTDIIEKKVEEKFNLSKDEAVQAVKKYYK